MNFDHIIMNPPYDKNLHLKILQEAMKHSNDVVNLSPVRWLQDPLAEYKKNSDWFRFEDIRSKIENLDIVNAQSATALFDVEFTMDLGVYHITSKGGWNEFEKNSIIKKVIESGHIGIPTVAFKNAKKKYFALLKGCDGSSHVELGQKSDGFILRKETFYGKYFIDGKSINGKTLEECKKSNKKATNGNINEWRIAEFDTENEVQNFYDFTKTNFVRYIYINEGAGRLSPQLKFLPFMPTYTHPWNDSELYKYFDLTEDEVKKIEKEMAEYSCT